MEKQSGSIKQRAFLGVLVLIIALFIVGYLAMNRQGGNKAVANGDQAPEFRLQAPDGAFFSLSDFRGKVVMVHFWATWCPPCVEELPTLNNLYRTFAGKDFEMLAVSVDEGGPEAVMSFIQKRGLNIPLLFDLDHAVASRYGTFKFPESYILDRNGVIRYKAIGPRDWNDPVNIKIVRDIIAGE